MRLTARTGAAITVMMKDICIGVFRKNVTVSNFIVSIYRLIFRKGVQFLCGFKGFYNL